MNIYNMHMANIMQFHISHYPIIYTPFCAPMLTPQQ